MSQSGCLFMIVVTVTGSLMGYLISKRSFRTVVVYGILGMIGAFLSGWVAMVYGIADMTATVTIGSRPFPTFPAIVGSWAFTTIAAIIARTTNNTKLSKEHYT